MTLPAIGSIDDFESYSGLSVDVERADASNSAASTLVRSYTGRTWVGADGEWEDDVTDLQRDVVTLVVLTVTDRVYRNPTGVTQQASGPFSNSVAAWAAYGLVLTDDEKALLPVSTGSGIPGLSSIRVEAPRRAAGVPRYADWCDEET